MRKAVLVVVLSCVLGGCGALFNSGPATVMFTSAPNEAEVWINGSRMGTTPVALQLAKNQNHNVVFKKAGYSDQTVPLNRKISAGYVILDVLGGVLPVVIDAATGAWYTLPTNSVNTTLSAAGTSLEGTLNQEQLGRLRSGASFETVVPLMDLTK